MNCEGCCAKTHKGAHAGAQDEPQDQRRRRLQDQCGHIATNECGKRGQR